MMVKCKLPYVKAEVDIHKTAFGFAEVTGIEQYENACLRDRIVFRIDELHAMSEWFEDTTLGKYRTLIYNIIVGNNRESSSLSEIFKALYIQDMKFRKFIGEKVYFGNECAEATLYDVIVDSFHKRLCERRNKLLSKLNARGLGAIAESHCYLYVSAPDADICIKLPKGYKGEVVSRAKVWKGDFARDE